MVLISWILPDDPGGITCMYIICVFYSSRIRTLVAMVTLSFHRFIMGKVEISYFLKTIAA